MRIMDFLNKNAVIADLKATDKEGIIKEMVASLVSSKAIKKDQGESAVSVLLEREELGSTGIGQGIGIPHGKNSEIKDLVAAFALSKAGVNFESLDGEPVYIFFLLLAPEESAGPHLKALSRISRLLKDKFFRDMLKNSKDAKEIIKIIADEDQRRQ